MVILSIKDKIDIQSPAVICLPPLSVLVIIDDLGGGLVLFSLRAFMTTFLQSHKGDQVLKLQSSLSPSHAVSWQMFNSGFHLGTVRAAVLDVLGSSLNIMALTLGATSVGLVCVQGTLEAMGSVGYDHGVYMTCRIITTLHKIKQIQAFLFMKYSCFGR